jgi:hypothetical protein
MSFLKSDRGGPFCNPASRGTPSTHSNASHVLQPLLIIYRGKHRSFTVLGRGTIRTMFPADRGAAIVARLVSADLVFPPSEVRMNKPGAVIRLQNSFDPGQRYIRWMTVNAVPRGPCGHAKKQHCGYSMSELLWNVLGNVQTSLWGHQLLRTSNRRRPTVRHEWCGTRSRYTRGIAVYTEQ